MSEISSDISSHKGRYDYNDSMSDINNLRKGGRNYGNGRNRS